MRMEKEALESLRRKEKNEGSRSQVVRRFFVLAHCNHLSRLLF